MPGPRHRKGCSPEKITYSRRMRKNRTPQERVLWERLRGRRLDDFKFRSQDIFFGYIVDFYCPAARLIVEIDGAYHNGRDTYDRERAYRIEKAGFKIIRFTNTEIEEALEAVLYKIKIVATERLSGNSKGKRAEQGLRSEARAEE